MDHQHVLQLIYENAKLDPYYHLADMTRWDGVLAILSENEEETIGFLEAECSQETLFWLAPLLPAISKAFQSRKFIEFLRYHLLELLDYPYCMENFLTPFMRDYVNEREFERTITEAIDAAEAAILE